MTTHLKIISQGSYAGNPRNEDRLGYVGDAAWLMDGATGLGPSKFSDKTDAEWLVGAVSNFLTETFTNDPDVDTVDALSHAIEAVGEGYRRATNHAELEPFARPSAGLSLVRVNGENVELSHLADVKAYVFDRSGGYKVYGGGPLEKLDNSALDALRKVQATQAEPDLKAAREEINPVLRQNRALMNTPGGYWVLTLDPVCLEGLQTEHLRAADISHILLATDGFYDLWENYVIGGLHDIKRRLIAGEDDSIVAELRRIETDDPHGIKHTRFKLHDDASWLLLAIEGYGEKARSRTGPELRE